MMAPDMSFSASSLALPSDDGSWSSDSGDYSSASSGDMHIGFSPRPQLSFRFPSRSVAKSLPHGFPGRLVSRRPKPPPHSKSAQPHPSSDLQRAPYLTLPPPPHPPPTPPPVLAPHPTTRPISVALPQALGRLDDGWSTDLGEPQHGLGDESPLASDSFFSSVQDKDETHIGEVTYESNQLQRLTEHYDELEHRRLTLWAVIDRARSKRAQIQHLRHVKNEVDRNFMATAQELLAQGQDLHQLHQLFKSMQQTYVQQQEAEQHLENILDELQHGHEGLGLQERAFYMTAMDALETTFSVKNYRDSHSDKSEDVALRGITGDRPEAIHPRYEKLREAFGELQLARELLANTQMKRQALHARKAQPLTQETLDLLENYGHAGRKKALQLRETALMTEEDNEQLQEYDELEQIAKRDIETYTERVRTLQEECREKGVLPSSSSFQQEGFGVDSYYREEIRLTAGPFDTNDDSATLAHPVFPLLLPNPTHLLHDFPQTALQSLKMALQLRINVPSRAKQVQEAAREANMHSLLSTVESDDKREYINRWLLHKLHHSAMEAELLWTTFRAKLKILDIDRWQRDVLHFWWRDEPVHSESSIMEDNGTDKASRSAGSGAGFHMLSYSESGQLDGLRNWKLDDSWL